MTSAKDKLSNSLRELLANTYTLYLKTQNFHWNVKGPMFHSLHSQFEEHYTEMAGAIDEIAERLRSLGYYAPGSFKEYLEISSVKECHSEISANDMLAQLVKDHETLREVIGRGMSAASELNDDVTMDLFVRRADVHEKAAWMLKSSLA